VTRLCRCAVRYGSALPIGQQLFRGYAADSFKFKTRPSFQTLPRRSREDQFSVSVRQSLTALEGGRAANHKQIAYLNTIPTPNTRSLRVRRLPKSGFRLPSLFWKIGL
jgi:hypothetical protein